MKDKSIITATVRRYSLFSGLLVSSIAIVTASLLYLMFSSMETSASSAAVKQAYRSAALLQSSSTLNGLKARCTDKNIVAGFTLFKQSRDDRYGIPIFSTESAIADIEGKTMISDSDQTLFEKAFIQIISDDKIYSEKESAFIIVYFPYDFENTRYIARALIPVSALMHLKIEQANHITNILKILLILSSFTFLLFFILSLIFSHQLRRIVARFSNSVQTALLKRELIDNNKTDKDFSQITENFNILLEEISEHKQTIDQLKLQSNDEEIFKHGVELLKKKDFVNAEHIFRTLTFIKPSSFGSYFNLGVIYARQKRWDESLFMFQKALSITPEDALSQQYCKKISKHIEPSLDNEKCS
ncbi:MAG: tetratricopeptide repeat protein [Spirochaetes bacterium]|jgi:tetratricopeptide (TPR) repeat protein|nr:tetratricopeptide repeat protein [Spirochaetota bacterium]